MLHKIAQSMSCTSEAKLGRWERETHFSLTALNPAPASMIKTNPSLMNLQTYLMVSIYTYTAHTQSAPCRQDRAPPSQEASVKETRWGSENPSAVTFKGIPPHNEEIHCGNKDPCIDAVLPSTRYHFCCCSLTLSSHTTMWPSHALGTQWDSVRELSSLGVRGPETGAMGSL